MGPTPGVIRRFMTWILLRIATAEVGWESVNARVERLALLMGPRPQIRSFQADPAISPDRWV
jgi:hypothetical protein